MTNSSELSDDRGMEILIDQQMDSIPSIANAVANLKKKGAAKMTLGFVESRIQLLKTRWIEFSARHLSLVGYPETERNTQDYFNQEVFTSTEEDYIDQMGELLDIKAELTLQSQPASHSSASLDASHMSDHGPPMGTNSQPPRLSLPRFSGNSAEWRNFRDLFKSMIIDRPDIPKVQKLQHLKSCLSAEPAQLLANISVNSDNFDIAWNLLDKRYDNKRLLINSHYATLWDIKPARSESGSELRRIYNSTLETLGALKSLDCPTDHWDIPLVFMTLRRLDPQTRRDWETMKGRETEPSSFKELSEFLESRIRALEALTSTSSVSGPRPAPATTKPFGGHNDAIRFNRASASSSFHSFTAQPLPPGAPSNNRKRCSLCRGDHYITACQDFKSRTVSGRREVSSRLNLCYNCLGHHAARDCKSGRTCATCQKKHNTLLHQEESDPDRSAIGLEAPAIKKGSNPSGTDKMVHHMSSTPPVPRRILLATARVKISSPSGHSCMVRTLLDQGSEVTLISEAVAQLLHLPRSRTLIPLVGIAATSTGAAKFEAKIDVSSQIEPNLHLGASVLILPKLTGNLPTTTVHGLSSIELGDLVLADPEFNKQDGVGMILGADLYGQILRDGIRSIPHTNLTAQNTAFGWVLSGPIRNQPSQAPGPSSSLSLHCVSNSDILQALQNFWNVEEMQPSETPMSPDDKWCEDHFKSTHSRTETGRYIVRLPYKPAKPNVADESRRAAVASLESLSRRLGKDPELKAQYSKFMYDYADLGHMRMVSPERSLPPSVWYIPHHPVIQSSGLKKKLRVVFDAARKTSAGHSLNDFLYAGPALQTDLSLVVSNWRDFKFVFSADIIKMFRQILIDQRDLDLRIVWANQDGSIVDYSLLTVTYGTRCAPFQAIRTLRQLAKDEGHRFPSGAHALIHETYVDDIFSGAHSFQSTIHTKRELVSILATAGFELDKWSANDPALLSNKNSSSSCPADHPRSFDLREPVKTLGIIWLPAEDSFSYRVPPSSNPQATSSLIAPTKRFILSNIARVFDPLGWIAPVTITAKVMMQDLWVLKLDWDTPLPPSFKERWNTYSRSLSDLSRIKINRWTGYSPDIQTIHIHGFADASVRAYAAAVYLHLVTSGGEIRVTLLTAKAKVSPVKTISIPRLELCAAALLVKLLLHIRKSPTLANVPITAWSDSQVALAWIRKHPSSWTTFVSNRVSYIQTSLPDLAWNHVSTKDNPADLATRGLTPSNLFKAELWWKGPAWLRERAELWPRGREIQEEENVPEQNPRALVMTVQRTDDFILDLISRFSSLNTLLKVVAYCLRFPIRCKKPAANLPSFITPQERNVAQNLLIKGVQASNFSPEIQALKDKSRLPKGSPLWNLNPFLDNDGILRVGGRLQKSALTFAEKHPPILPKTSHLSTLFISEAHSSSLHGGTSLTLGILLKSVWVLNAKVLVKARIRNCIICYRNRPRLGSQLMRNLPAERITPSRAFSKAGLDYAGPVSLLVSRGRARTTYKGYICLFVCLVSRAIHLEAVSDCTSQAFIAAFRRFSGRRGIPFSLHSDNSTTFKGACAELNDMFNESSDFYKDVSQVLAKDNLAWHFIPPQAPHFGGIWEAGVKSVKFHLRRVIGDQRLTFEELSTVLVQIEACLNSRPLSPISSDPDDLSILTPAHFLVGSSLFTVPEPDLTEEKLTHLSRWQLVQRMYQDFWEKWSIEYMHHLQQRHKWRSPQENFFAGQLVLVQDDRHPPSKWPLGRIVEVHPGSDGFVRAATVRTASSEFRRPITRLSPLPISMS